MYTDDHLRRVQDYILRNPDLSFYVFHSPYSSQPDLLGDVTYRTSPYVQKGSLLVLDKDGTHRELVARLSFEDPLPMPGQHALFTDEDTVDYWPVTGDDLRGLAAREALS
jgi:hypothetical protein